MSLPSKIENVEEFFALEKLVENKIGSDKHFKEFISQVENALHAFLDDKYVYQGKFSLEKDFELSELEKLVLSLKFENLSNEVKLRLWDEIDDAIRIHLETLVKESEGNKVESFKNLNLNFYTNVQLD